MKIISHRGNLIGSEPNRENDPFFILEAISAGFDVEIDVWYDTKKEQYFLGHDSPVHLVSKHFLYNQRLWCHAKNKEAFYRLLQDNIHCFWHEKDCYTLTSNGIPWSYPNNWIENGVTVVFEPPCNTILSKNIFGICVDDPIEWNKLL